MLHAVIDAGSSGTRLFLYRVVPGAAPVVERIAEHAFQVMPCGEREDGINNFVEPAAPERERRVGPEVIVPLLDAVRPALRELGDAPGLVEVDLFATAGMRYAERLHGIDAVARFYDLIREAIAGAGFRVGQVRTIRGDAEEGLWTWINLNDVHQRLFTTGTTPLGIVEIGGSSAQFIYPLDGLAGGAEPDVFPVSINGRDFLVYSKTCLGLGQDDARKAMRQRAGDVRAAVCFPTGFSARHDLGDVLDGIAEFFLAADGDYDFDDCTSLYDAIIAEQVAAAGDPRLERFAGEFVGIDGAWHATSRWRVHEDPRALHAAILAHCHDVGNFDGIEADAYAQMHTANATYVNALLFGARGLLRHRPEKLVRAVPSKVDGRTVLTWTRGYLLQRHGATEAR